jgi:hypothetical protein
MRRTAKKQSQPKCSGVYAEFGFQNRIVDKEVIDAGIYARRGLLLDQMPRSLQSVAPSRPYSMPMLLRASKRRHAVDPSVETIELGYGNSGSPNAAT